MGSFSATCEISEEIEEHDYYLRNSIKAYGIKQGKLPFLREALEDDIGMLFESFNLRNSSKTASSSNQVAAAIPLRKKNALKKPISVGSSSETVNLKQALKDLSLSKASEMAAMKRLSKSNASKGISEAGRIKNLYDTKIVEGSEPGGFVLEISLVPEDKASNPNSSIPNESLRAEVIKKGKTVVSPLSLSNSFKDKVKNPRKHILGKLPRKTPCVVRNTTITKKKAKQDLISAASCSDDLVCKTCLYSLQIGSLDSLENPKSNSRLRDKTEFSHSSSSLGDFSSSTASPSDESNLSRSSCSNRPHMSKDVRWEAIRHVRRQHRVPGLNLSHFNLLKNLGSGDIGTVYLAELIGTDCLFAIKVMDNEFLARREKLNRTQTEREILRLLDHPFLPTLYSQFVSKNLSCLVMEYCPGGDLHVLRQNQPEMCFTESAARFYVAEVLLALEYLHMLGVIYRDLKPENILVREDGHIMLTNFDLSLRCTVCPTLLQSPQIPDPTRLSGSNPFCIKPPCRVLCFAPRFLPQRTTGKLIRPDMLQLVAEPTDARSNSIVGTHEYLAPEIIKGGGHGAVVDWWTLGIFLYELLYGKTPFRGSGNEGTLGNVVFRKLEFPNDPNVSVEARDIIGRLLVKEPENRLGAEKGAAEIKQHPFFEGLNWALIRCSVPPELPEVAVAPEMERKYLEFNATGDQQIEFELF